MKIRSVTFLVALVLAVSGKPALAEFDTKCPGPMFQCVGPGPYGFPEEAPFTNGTTLTPTLLPVTILIDSTVNFNQSIGILRNGSWVIREGIPKFSEQFSKFLLKIGGTIDPSAVYLVSPTSLFEPPIDGDAVLIGGEALTS